MFVLGLFAQLQASCGGGAAAPSHFERELTFLRLGVELDEEDRAVRQVLAQRRLSIADETRGPGFLALFARTFEARLSAIRVITGRGVVHAEDAALDDLFAPGSLQLLSKLPTSIGDYIVVAWTRIPRGEDLGCATLLRILPDGNVVPGLLDVSTLGPRACVSELQRTEDGRFSATIAFPGLRSERAPYILAELGFQEVPLGRPTPFVPVATIRSDGAWLEVERSHWEAALPAHATFSERHAVGVSRAAIALLSGQSTAAQTAAYRRAVERVAPGSSAAELVADTVAYFKRGWLDRGPAVDGVEAGDEVIDPSEMEAADAPDTEQEPGEEIEVIEPSPL